MRLCHLELEFLLDLCQLGDLFLRFFHVGSLNPMAEFSDFVFLVLEGLVEIFVFSFQLQYFQLFALVVFLKLPDFGVVVFLQPQSCVLILVVDFQP